MMKNRDNKMQTVKLLLLWLCMLVVFFVFTGIALAVDENGNRIMVSMGDSYSSGEGIEDFYGQDLPAPEKYSNPDWLAHRSQNSWSGMLELAGKKMADYRVFPGEEMADNQDAYWFFVAASGAETKHIQGKQGKTVHQHYRDYSSNDARKPIEYNKSFSLDPQIKVFSDYNLNGKVDYVTMTFGGNDAKFTEIVQDGAIDRLDFINIANLTNKLNTVWNSFYAEDGIRDDLRNAYMSIQDAAGPQAKIIVAGYPKLFDVDAFNIFSRENKIMINESVTRFNDEIESLVNSCKADGMKICFVSVEEEFYKHGVDADNAYLNGVVIGSKLEDLDEFSVFSSYSVHPNLEGAAAYARCVQDKIDSIEKDGGRSEWPEMFGSEERDVALVLDASGSMDGTPIQETKNASMKFVNTALQEDVGIGAIIYDSSAQPIAVFNRNEKYLNNVIETISAGGGTNIEAGLARAEMLFDSSNAKKKYIVLMSDGEANEGKVGDELIEYAESLKDKGFRIYTLGFFSELSSKAEPQALMESIATDGCHYEVDDAEQLEFFFDDIAEQIKGTKYYYIRIQCPVDVTVSYGGETLSSKGADKNQRTSFGTMTFEDNAEQSSISDNRIKTLRLKEGVNYDIKIEGNGEGYMSYTIGFMDEDGEYTDLRSFDNIIITQDTEIDTMAAYSNATTMKVDEDGDGKYDYIYKAEQNGKGELFDYKHVLKLLLMPVGILVFFILVAVFIKTAKKRSISKTNE